jgi:hypothetical protein
MSNLQIKIINKIENNYQDLPPINPKIRTMLKVIDSKVLNLPDVQKSKARILCNIVHNKNQKVTQ